MIKWHGFEMEKKLHHSVQAETYFEFKYKIAFSLKKEIESLWVNSSSSLVLDRWYKKLHFLRKLVLHFYQKWSLLSFRIFYSGRMSRFFGEFRKKSDTLTKSKIEFSNFPKWMRRKAVWPTLSIDFKAQQSWQHWIEI